MATIKTTSISQDFFNLTRIIVVSVALVCAWFYWDVYKFETGEIRQELEINANRLERDFTSSLDYTVYMMDYMSRQIRANPTDLNLTNELLASFRLDPKMHNILSWNMFSWVNTNGMLIVNSDKGILKEPVDVSQRDYIPQTRAHPGTLQTGTPSLGLISNSWIMPAGMGIADEHGKYLGTIVFGVSLEKLSAIMSESLLSRNIDYVIVNSKFEKVVPLLGADEKQKTKKTDDLLEVAKNTAMEENFGNLGRFSFINPDTTLMYYVKSKKYPFTVMVRYSWNAAANKMLYNLAPKIIEFVVFGGFLVFLLYMFYRRIVEPVLQLSQVAERIARGDLEVSIDVKGPVEIGNLAEHLINVSRYIDELRLIRQELTRKIRELEEVIAEQSGRRE